MTEFQKYQEYQNKTEKNREIPNTGKKKTKPRKLKIISLIILIKPVFKHIKP